jgi:membrane protease YdiL (CAAX protease family)
VIPGFLHPSIPLSSIPLSLFLCVFLCVLCASAFHFVGASPPISGFAGFLKRSLDIPGGIIHTVGAMMRFFRSEAGAVLLWVAASLLLAALIVPWLYQGGTGLAELLNAQAGGGVAGWLGQACRRADFGRYFNRSLLLAALVLLPVLWRRLRRLEPIVPPLRVAESWYRGPLLWVTGLVAAGGVVWGLGMILAQVGTFSATPAPPSVQELLSTVGVSAVAVSVIEEWLFRGLLLGLWLRVARPVTACIGSSLVFAFVHFLNPPAGYAIADPTSPVAGLHWLGGILRHFADPGFIAADFLTLFGVGLVLAGARLRTGHLWLSMGLHCGWVIAFKVFNLTHLKLADGPVNGMLIGDNLRSGLLPLATLGLTAWICHVLLGAIRYRARGSREC